MWFNKNLANYDVRSHRAMMFHLTSHHTEYKQTNWGELYPNNKMGGVISELST